MTAHVLTEADLQPLWDRIARLEERLGAAPAGEDLTTEQAAAIAGVKPKTVRGWVEAGDLPAERRRRRLRIRRADLQTYLAGSPRRAAALLSTLTPDAR